ncbi:hypothetical protein jhhlp_000024 [Lomentospora prolificans]|uniref:Uncharacterized protein n=1 Tax=Lomentospora prolificans TaxID=41688 RepID=A0A2N3NLD4_9PEZI|nr:hypothetical protein jhhlp_000024 [Lomentospora prolificans]
MARPLNATGIPAGLSQLSPQQNDAAALTNETGRRIGPEDDRGAPGGTVPAPEQDTDSSEQGDEEDLPESYAYLNELAAPSPSHRERLHDFLGIPDLENARASDELAARRREVSMVAATHPEEEMKKAKREKASHIATQLYTHCYLILFSVLGTLARLGLQALTHYPGAPVAFSVVWANSAGSLILGFLTEDRMLFQQGKDHLPGHGGRNKSEDTQKSTSSSSAPPPVRKSDKEIKKTIPLYVGLATGFCGSFTSFSSFIRDAFLALSNDLKPTDMPSPASRNGGYSFMAFLSVIITSISLSLSGLFIGVHLAEALDSVTPSLPYRFVRYFLDRIAVPVAVAIWLAAIFLSIFPPADMWRGDALFALVFSPLGCMARFYLSLFFNKRIPSFPLGTFLANLLGTAILGICWDLSHSSIGGVVGCQVLQGIEDGFCGCLTTVSTWVLELATLRRAHAYRYGAASVVVSVLIMIAIMGSLRWSQGFAPGVC